MNQEKLPYERNESIMAARRSRQARNAGTMFMAIGCMGVIIAVIIIFFGAIFSRPKKTYSERENERRVLLKAALEETDPEKKEKLLQAFDKVSDDLYGKRK